MFKNRSCGNPLAGDVLTTLSNLIETESASFAGDILTRGTAPGEQSASSSHIAQTSRPRMDGVVARPGLRILP